MTAASKRRVHRVLFPGLVLLAVLGGLAIVKFGRHHLWPKRFAEVEPGRVYRAGYCQPGPLADVIRKHHIKSILTLLSNEPDSPEQVKEEAVARREKVEILRISMPGDGRAGFAQLDAAADLMADRARQPLLVHCSGGVNRTGAACVAYRLKYCGWTIDRALAEVQIHGYSSTSNPQLAQHLRDYAAYLAARAASHPAGATTASTAISQ